MYEKISQLSAFFLEKCDEEVGGHPWSQLTPSLSFDGLRVFISFFIAFGPILTVKGYS